MKILRVDVNDKIIASEELKDEWKYFGNRGLVDKVLTDEVDPKCDALGTENKLIFATGLFAGTPIPTSNRLSVGCKSPLTGGIKEANSGGNFAANLSTHGIRAIIIDGVPTDDKWHFLRIDSEGLFYLMPADEYIGLGTYQFVEKMHELYGTDIGVACIGICGERLNLASTIQVTDNATGHPCRAAARGGVGAVMGSKKIKGIVIEKANEKFKFEPVDKALFNSGKKAMIDMIKSWPATGAAMGMLGTAAFLDVTAEDGIMPVKNFSGERLGGEKLSCVDTRSFITHINANKGKVGVPCQAGCTVRCSNVYNDKNENLLTSGLEYETIALNGANCDIYDMDFIAEADRFCDDVGLDTIELGCGIAIAMDEGKINWGDIDAVKKIYKDIEDGTEFGMIAANGAQSVGNYLNAKRIPTVRNQAMAAYDPRGTQGMGITFSTSTQGADHTTVNTLGIDNYNHQATSGIGEIIKSARLKTTLGDNILCSFAALAIANDKDGLNAIAEALSGLYGTQFTGEQVLQIGADTLEMEYAFNEKAGWKIEDSKLPDFFHSETAASTGVKFDVGREEILASL